MKKIILIVLISIFLVGCNSSNEVKKDNELLNGNFIITPSTMFKSDEMKVLEPHLNLRTGCVEIQYNGEKKWLSTKYEIWENGELQNSHENFAVSIINNKKDNDFDYNGSISISINDYLISDDFHILSDMTMITAIDGSSSKKIIQRYDEKYSSSIFNLKEQIEVNDTEEVAVWALIGIDDKNGSRYSPKSTIEETVKETDWALVLKVYFSDDKLN
ncbi:hypothetical protein QUF55_00980 [Clostridiaceae bacterium HSG29]|nr:hypothetical protein [Clostridiaceae bacterium HSG29]